MGAWEGVARRITRTTRGRRVNEYSVKECRVKGCKVNEYRVNEYRVNEYRVKECKVNEYRVNEYRVTGRLQMVGQVTGKRRKEKGRRTCGWREEGTGRTKVD